MTRTDTHLDAMLRHLGAAYYDSLLGRAAPGDVSRALDRVAEQMGEPGKPASPAAARRQHAPQHPPQHHGRWHSRVRDVMTTSVVTVDRITPYKTIAELLAQHQVSGVPVLILGRHVAGVVSEADLLAAQTRQRPDAPRSGWRKAIRKDQPGQHHEALTAEQLMTAPAITIHPDASIAAAARLMNEHHVRRLPVVDPDGKLLGLVSRRDLLSVFLRDDEDIARQVRELLAEILPDAAWIKVVVHSGVVSLIGQPADDAQGDMLALAVRLTWDVDGVVDVVNKISSPA